MYWLKTSGLDQWFPTWGSGPLKGPQEKNEGSTDTSVNHKTVYIFSDFAACLVKYLIPSPLRPLKILLTKQSEREKSLFGWTAHAQSTLGAITCDEEWQKYIILKGHKPPKKVGEPQGQTIHFSHFIFHLKISSYCESCTCIVWT